MKKIILSLAAVLALPLGLSASSITTTVCDDYGACKTAYTSTNSSIKQYQIGNSSLYNKLRGRIILTVQSNGEAYYVSPNKPVVYYLGNIDAAAKILLGQGRGISNEDLARIKVGVVGMYDKDADSDGLPDKFEAAIGTNLRNFNTDGDTYSDFVELTNGYNPFGPGRLPISVKYSNSLKGQVLLQVQKNGEAWYVNPADGRRYFLGSKYYVNDVINKLGLGISNKDFDSLIK